MRIFENTQIDFLKKQRFAAILSGVLVVLSLVSMLTRGLETGIDFQGGTEIVIETDVALDAVDVRASLSDALGATPEVKEYGEPELLLIRMPSGGDPDSLQTLIVGAVNAAFPGANATPQKVDSVGPRFADDLKRGAIWAVLAALLVIFLYIMVRFEWRFSVGAIVALMHDVIITLGIFSLLHGVLPFSLQIDQAIIAALLTIVGYSLNDTVVIFDRIREFVNLFKTERFGPVVSRSINSTLSRTVVTSGTTLIAVGVLFIFGGDVRQGFAFALIIGVVVVTYASRFVPSPVVIALRARTGKAV